MGWSTQTETDRNGVEHIDAFEHDKPVDRVMVCPIDAAGQTRPSCSNIRATGPEASFANHRSENT